MRADRVKALCDWLDTIPPTPPFFQHPQFVQFSDMTPAEMIAARDEMQRRSADAADEAAALANTMPEEAKLVIVGLGVSPPAEGADVQDPRLIGFLEELIELGVAIAVTSRIGRRFHLTRFGREIFDIVKGQPCNL